MGCKSSKNHIRSSPGHERRIGRWLLVLLGVCVLALEAYGPALRGPFLFDDWTLPFTSPQFADAPLGDWLKGVRPTLMFSYWVNRRSSGGSTLSYHVLNVLLHVANSVLVFLVLRRLLPAEGERRVQRLLVAGFGSAIFLLHPLQTESVAYIAGRSELLSALFFLTALTIYLRKDSGGISWREAAVLVLLFAAGAAAKEHVVAVVPAAFLLTEWHRSGAVLPAALRRHWRLYIPLALATLVGAIQVSRLIATAPSLGQALDGITPLNYFFSQGRAILTYLRLFVLPVGQNFDYDFPLSRTIVEHGAIFAIAAVALLTTAAFWFRSRWPLVCYGLLMFLVLLAPTSSFIPIADLLVEHRMYLPLLGLVVTVCGLLVQLRLNPRNLLAAMTAVLVCLGALTWRRNQTWSDAVVFWQDVVAKSPRKARPYPHLTYSYIRAKRCAEAVEHLERVAGTLPRQYYILVNWALAYDCVRKYELALAKLREAAQLNATPDVYALMSAVLAKQGRRAEALDAIRTGLAKEARGSDMAHVYKGHWHSLAERPDLALEEYRRALELNPSNPEARRAYYAAQERLRSAPLTATPFNGGD